MNTIRTMATKKAVGWTIGLGTALLMALLDLRRALGTLPPGRSDRRFLLQAAIASVIGNQSFIAPFPSFNFEDLGLNLKATPYVHGDQDVTLKLELQIRSLGTQNVNGIPIINNREYNGQITVRDGESSVVTGLIDMSDTRSINGYPFLGQVPGLSYGTSVRNKNVAEDELLVVITPHILRLSNQTPFAMELPPSH